MLHGSPNESKYTLVSCVYTQEHEKALQISRKVNTGVVSLNDYPLGGAKSGYGGGHCVEAKSIQQSSGMARTLTTKGCGETWL
jgi:acyl-CoA reductase-like NAD-dependent aldehyde dehydrogenase